MRGTITHVRDGDTFEVNGIPVRLAALDCPENNTKEGRTASRFAKKFKGHGWMGIRFQTKPDEPYSMITTHVRFRENDTKTQQLTLGVIGVNLIYGAFYQNDRPKKMLQYLYDFLLNKFSYQNLSDAFLMFL